MDIPVQITAGSAGPLQVSASFPQALVDADQGAPVSVAPVSTTAVQVQGPGALAIQVRAPQLVEGFNATLTVEVSNTGGAEVSGLTLGALDLTDAAGAVVSHGPATLPAGPLAGGARGLASGHVEQQPGRVQVLRDRADHPRRKELSSARPAVPAAVDPVERDGAAARP